MTKVLGDTPRLRQPCNHGSRRCGQDGVPVVLAQETTPSLVTSLSAPPSSSAMASLLTCASDGYCAIATVSHGDCSGPLTGPSGLGGPSATKPRRARLDGRDAGGHHHGRTPGPTAQAERRHLGPATGGPPRPPATWPGCAATGSFLPTVRALRGRRQSGTRRLRGRRRSRRPWPRRRPVVPGPGLIGRREEQLRAGATAGGQGVPGRTGREHVGEVPGGGLQLSGARFHALPLRPGLLRSRAGTVVVARRYSVRWPAQSPSRPLPSATGPRHPARRQTTGRAAQGT